jgi:hypothetical protein
MIERDKGVTNDRYSAVHENYKSFYFDDHSGLALHHMVSGLDPKTNLFAPLDSCLHRNDRFGAIQKSQSG